MFLCLLASIAAPAAARAAEGLGAQGVIAWGENEVGQLGDGSTAETDTPVAVPGLSDTTALSIGRRFGLALLGDGTVMSWGENAFGQLGDGTDTGPETCHASFAEASGYEVPCSTTPAPVTDLSDVVAVATGAQHGLALLSNGTVMAWGDNEDGELGDGTNTSSNVPVAVHGLSEVLAIAADQQSSLAVLKDGTVMSWGYDGWGALGQGSGDPSQDLPAPVSDLTNAKAIAGYLNSNLALLADGTVAAWGENGFGELGDGTTAASFVPVAVSGLSDVRAIARGEDSLALLADGTVMAWGSNISGQLGIGTFTGPTECFLYNFCSLMPVPVSELKGATAIAAGNQHNLALLSDGEVSAWGENWDGQLGTGNTASTDAPTPVPGLIDVSEIAAGENRSFAYGVLGEPMPEVSGLSPASGSQMGGTTVTITGGPLVRLVSARLHGSTLLLTLEGACTLCKVRLTVAAVPGAGHGPRAGARDAAHVSKREPPRFTQTVRVVQTKTVTLTSAKKLSLDVTLNAASRALLRTARELALTLRCNEGATLVMGQTLQLKTSRQSR